MEFTPEELTYLQELLTAEREGWFNYYIDCIGDDRSDRPNTFNAYDKYHLARALRDKFYRLGGRDTLAPGVHEQRGDQGHDQL